MTKELRSAWWALRIGLGPGPLLAGLDKFFNLLTDWEAGACAGQHPGSWLRRGGIGNRKGERRNQMNRIVLATRGGPMALPLRASVVGERNGEAVEVTSISLE